jgi:hypothetical protein
MHWAPRPGLNGKCTGGYEGVSQVDEMHSVRGGGLFGYPSLNTGAMVQVFLSRPSFQLHQCGRLLHRSHVQVIAAPDDTGNIPHGQAMQSVALATP